MKIDNFYTLRSCSSCNDFINGYNAYRISINPNNSYISSCLRLVIVNENKDEKIKLE